MDGLIHCGFRGFKKLCQTDRLLSFLAFQKTFWNKKAWNCVPLHKVFRKNSYAPILDTTCTFACKFGRIFQIILTVPTWNIEHWHALKRSFDVQTRLMLHEMVFSPSLLTQRWMRYLKQKANMPSYNSDVVCAYSVQCWPSINAPVLTFCLPTWPPQSRVSPK